MNLPQRFEAEIARAAERLAAVTEEQAAQPYRQGSWTRKQVLGHLLDSAVNNHVRFVLASLQDEYAGPTYQQEEWVRRTGFGDLPWERLRAWWQSYNDALTHIVSRIPPEKYGVRCVIVGYPREFTLETLIVDYLDHLRQHVDQICGRAANA
jgi:hypothetical protein